MPRIARLGARFALPLLALTLAIGPGQHSVMAANGGILWGIDTTDNVQAANDIVRTQGQLGSPQFVGRYFIWDGGPTLSIAEANYIHSQNLPILLLDSPANSNLTGSAVGADEAQKAINKARSMGVPPGTALFRDVETGYGIDAAYISAFYGTIRGSGYVPGFYENAVNGAFSGAYCGAVAQNPVIGTGTALFASEWEFQGGDPHRAAMRTWGPATPPCQNTTVAWQYEEKGLFPPGLPAPNVDVDEYQARYCSLLWGASCGGDSNQSAGSFSPVGQNTDGRLEVFARSSGDGTVYHDWQLWSAGWYPLTNFATSDAPIAASNSDGRLEVFATGTDGVIAHNWQPTFGTWYGLSGFAASGSPAVARNRDGRLEIFATSRVDGTISHIWQTAPNSGWGPWYSLSGMGGFQAVGNSDGRLEVFAVGRDGAMYHSWQTSPNGGWSPFSSLGGTIFGQISIANNSDGRLEVLVRSTGGSVWHIWQASPSAGWAQWSPLGGSIAGNPVVALNQDGTLEVFALGTDRTLQSIAQISAGGGWGGWFSLTQNQTNPTIPGGLIGDPVLGLNTTGPLEAFIVGADSQLYHTWQGSPGIAWTKAGPLAGTGQQPAVPWGPY
jgi:hypothetical protein